MTKKPGNNGRSHFTMMPNMIDDMNLSVYAVRLYFRIKRRAGDDGKCWENTEHLAAGCSMSEGSVSKAKKELASAGLISIHKEKNPHGGKDYDVITINDIWSENVVFYTSQQTSNQPSSPGELASSPGEIKNIPNNKIQREEENQENTLSPRAPLEGNRVSPLPLASFSEPIHPAVEAVISILGIQLREGLWGWAIERLGDNPDIEKLQLVKDAWDLEGNRPSNLKGILDWYKDGIPVRKPRKKKVDPANPYIKDDEWGEVHFLWCPDDLRPIAEAIIEDNDIYPYSGADKKQWIKELERFRRTSVTPSDVRDAIDKLRGDDMIVSSPKSVYATAVNISIRNERYGFYTDDENGPKLTHNPESY